MKQLHEYAYGPKPKGITIFALGARLRPLERIATVGDLLGLNRATAYRLSESDQWVLVGPPTSRWVLTIPLFEKYGIPYQTADPEGPNEGQHISSATDTDGR